MYKNLLQIFIASALVQFSLLAQNTLEISSVVKGNYEKPRSLNISVNDSGKELFAFEKTLMPHQSIPNIEVLSNSYIILVYSLEGIIEIYNGNGSLISKNEFYKLPPYNEQRILFDLFDSGFVLLVSESQKNKIYILDNSGNINYSKDIKEGLVKGLAINKNAKFIACSIMNWDIDNLENKIIITNTKNNSEINFYNQFENGIFNENDNLFLGLTNKTAFIYELTEQKTLWTDELDDNKLFIDGEISKNKTLLVKSKIPVLSDNEWVYDEIQIIQKDEIGNEKVLYSSDLSVKKIELNKVNSKFQIKLDNESIEFKID